MNPHYYVYRTDEARGPKVKHARLAEAQAESERLANQHPGSVFEILRCVAITRCTQASTFWLDGEEPPEKPRYRMLEVGELVEDGDEFEHPSGDWKRHGYAVGLNYGPGIKKTRRPL